MSADLIVPDAKESAMDATPCHLFEYVSVSLLVKTNLCDSHLLSVLRLGVLLPSPDCACAIRTNSETPFSRSLSDGRLAVSTPRLRSKSGPCSRCRKVPDRPGRLVARGELRQFRRQIIEPFGPPRQMNAASLDLDPLCMHTRYVAKIYNMIADADTYAASGALGSSSVRGGLRAD